MSRLEYREDDEFTLHRIDPTSPVDSSDDSDMEAPSSLIIEREPLQKRISTTDRIMWRWANVENMDLFFERVYDYFEGKGIYCILLARFLNLLTLGFIIVFSTFLIGCVNYSQIPTHHTLAQVIEPQCLSKLSATQFLFVSIFVLWWIWQAIRFISDLSSLHEIHNFYNHLLHIPDEDMQTVSWQTVVERIMDIREANYNLSDQSPIRLTEHSVASRIMRQENYLIALFNKDILDITIPLPYLRHRHIFTKDLEWNLSFCLLDFVFDRKGQLRKRFLKERNKHLLVAELRRRFVFMGLLNLVLSPFIFVYLLLFFFFKYFEEYHKNPGAMGSRGYSTFAKWKFREFNELPHFFRNRINQSYEFANLYINQFPKEKTILLARFVSFIVGSFAGVLALFTLFESEHLLSFEITPNGNVLFYLGITGTVFAITRGMIPDESNVFEPEKILRQVVEHTHYLPAEWKHRLHTDQVRGEFCLLFDYKVGLFLQELLSTLFVPLVLAVSLPKSADQIISFFREFSVHVDGLGYVCSFTEFDLERHGNVKYGVVDGQPDEHLTTKDGKMEKSLINFKANNPHWEPADLSGSVYLNRLAGRYTTLNQYGVPELPVDDSWKQDMEEEEEEEEEELNRREGMVGLLNQFYDLNNNPTV